MTNKEIISLIESRWNDWKYGSSTEAKYKAEECKDILELIEESQVKESAKTQHIDETCKNSGNSLTQESEATDFEQELYKAFGQIKDFTLGIAIAKRFYDMGRKHNEPVSEDFEEAIGQSFIYHENRGDDFRSDEQLETAYRYGFETGAKWQKEQMMKDAIIATIESDLDPHGADYGNQKIICEWGELEAKKFKNGSKVKLIIIKED